MKEKRFKYFLPAVLWAIAIMIVSSIPNLQTRGMRLTFADKVAHFLEYFILGLFTAHAMRAIFKNYWAIFAMSSLTAAVYGILDEIHQLYVPGRSMEGLDMLADILGSVLASALFVRYLQRREKKRL